MIDPRYMRGDIIIHCRHRHRHRRLMYAAHTHTYCTYVTHTHTRTHSGELVFVLDTILHLFPTVWRSHRSILAHSLHRSIRIDSMYVGPHTPHNTQSTHNSSDTVHIWHRRHTLNIQFHSEFFLSLCISTPRFIYRKRNWISSTKYK